MDKFEQECLDEHNKYRALHGVAPLTLNKKLCAYATEWAQHLASTDCLQHRPNLKYGENIYWSSGSGTIDGRKPVQNWYEETKKYNYQSRQFNSSTGHFTQVVWKNSKEIGVGYVQKGSAAYVVVNYDPPGNYNDQYMENVFPPK